MRTKLLPITVALLFLAPLGASAQDVNSVLAGKALAGGEIRNLDAADGSTLASATPFGASFAGGVRVASGDINGDGTPDFIAGGGLGSGQVRVLNGNDLSVLFTLTPFGASHHGGVYVASGDIDGDSRDDVIVGAGVGGGSGAGQIKVYSGVDQHLIVTRTPFGSHYVGGVTVAAGDIDGDSRDDIIAGTAVGGTFKVIDGVDGSTIMSGQPYGALFIAGINVASGDVNGDTRDDVITGPGLVLRQVKVFSGIGGGLITTITPYPSGGAGGVSVAAGDVNGDNFADIITGPGPGTQPRIKIFSGLSNAELVSFLAFGSSFRGGVFVAAVKDAQTELVFTSADETTFQVGVAGTFDVTTTGGAATPTLTVTGTLPAGVTFTDNGDGTGTLAGTPDPGTGGVYSLVFHANDGVNPVVDQNFTLTVNDAPAITSANSTTFNVGMSSSFTVTSTGFPTPALTETGALPTGVTFTDNGDSTGTLTGTPTQSGVFPIQFHAVNGVPPDALQNFTLTVACPAITVTPSGALANGLFGVPYGPVNFSQTGSTGSSITWTATGLPLGLTIGTSSGVLSGTPNNTVVNGAITVTATDEFGCSGSSNVTLTIRPVAGNDSYSGGVGGTQFSVGVVVATPNVFVAGNVKSNDAGPAPVDVTFGPAANGIVAEGGVDGTFVYTPNLNFAGPSDSFSYTLTDGNGVTNTATVTIALSNLVWYVNSGGPNGDGRSHNPFNNLLSAGAASASNSYIYVHTGAPTTPGALAMDANQTLHGAAVTFLLNGLIIPATGAPTATETTTLAGNTIVTGLNYSTGAAPALAASAVGGTVLVDQVNTSGGTSALALNNVSGSVAVTNSSFVNASGAEVQIIGGTGAVAIGATISSNAGRSVDVENRTGGTVTFSGAITDTASGVLLNANGTSTIAFAGGVTLNGASSTFTATGGGIVSVTGTNTIGAGTAATTTALNISNMTIAPSGVTFQSISSNGGAKGVILNSLAGGAFAVTGTGAAGTGGTIQNASMRGAEIISADNASFSYVDFTNNGTSGAGVLNAACGNALAQSTLPVGVVAAFNCEANVYLQSASGVVLNAVRTTQSNGAGIWGRDVNGLTLTNVEANENGEEQLEDGVQLVNLSGTVNVTGGNFKDNASRGFEVQNNSGAATVTFDGTAFGNTNFPNAVAVAPSPGSATATGAVLLATNGGNSASITSTTRNASFDRVFGVAFFVDMAGNTSQNVTFGQTGQGNTVTTSSQGVSIVGTNSGGLTASIVDNVLNNDETLMDTAGTTVINVRRGGGVTPASGDWNVAIENNDIGINGDPFSGCEIAACSGISVDDQGTPSGIYTVLIQNNTVYRVSGPGILAGNAGAGAHTLNVKILNNTVGDPELNALGAGGQSQGAGILVQNGTATTATTNAQIEDNTVSGLWDGAGSRGLIRVRHASAPAAMNLCGYLGSTAAQINAFLAAENPLTLDPDGAGPFTIASAAQPIGDPVGNGCPP
jgi:hypothetical protein